MPHVDLLELPFFEGISLEHLVRLVDSMRPCCYAPGEELLAEGVLDGFPKLLIATHGQIEMSKRCVDGKNRALAQMCAPTLCGEIELFCEIAPVCSVKALTSVSAFALDRPTFDGLVDSQDPAVTRFAANVARVACHRLAVSDAMLSQMLDQGNLVELRREVFADMRGDDNVSHTTGVFRRPKF